LAPDARSGSASRSLASGSREAAHAAADAPVPGFGDRRQVRGVEALIEEGGLALEPTARCDATLDYSRCWEPPYLSALYGLTRT
jgi:hypothetical protein